LKQAANTENILRFEHITRSERRVQIPRYEEGQKETAPENSQGKKAGKA
jgi:hypothetical protein